MVNPSPFTGSAEECSGFILQCQLVLEMLASQFSTEHSKIAYVISLLKGRALQWPHTIWDQGGSLTDSFDDFIWHFKVVFSHPASDSSISEQLLRIRQGRRAITHYALQF